MNTKESVQEKQNQIFRQMSADKKIKMVDDFYRYSLKLQSKSHDHSKIHQSNQRRLRPA